MQLRDSDRADVEVAGQPVSIAYSAPVRAAHSFLPSATTDCTSAPCIAARAPPYECVRRSFRPSGFRWSSWSTTRARCAWSTRTSQTAPSAHGAILSSPQGTIGVQVILAVCGFAALRCAVLCRSLAGGRKRRSDCLSCWRCSRTSLSRCSPLARSGDLATAWMRRAAGISVGSALPLLPAQIVRIHIMYIWSYIYIIIYSYIQVYTYIVI